MWVVVNEGIADGGGALRDTLLHQIIGDEVIRYAFEKAAAVRDRLFAASGRRIVLLYNDYNLEHDTAKLDTAIRYFKSRGLHTAGALDAFGFQCHIEMGHPSAAAIKASLQKAYAELGVQIWVTELDIALSDKQIAGQYGGSTADALRAQRQRYHDVFKVCFDLFDAGVPVKNITTWGLTDAYSWLINQYPEQGAQHPLVFDAFNQAKPAYHGIFDAAGNAKAQARE
jgi:endo-1,4-beta-xylanase